MKPTIIAGKRSLLAIIIINMYSYMNRIQTVTSDGFIEQVLYEEDGQNVAPDERGYLASGTPKKKQLKKIAVVKQLPVSASGGINTGHSRGPSKLPQSILTKVFREAREKK